MRILRSSRQTPLLFLGFFAVAARVGFISSALIILMGRFHVTAILAAVMSIVLQGSITVMRRLCLFIHGRTTLLKSQRIGSVIGAGSCLTLIFVHNIYIFFAVVFVASFSKVLIDGTFPKVAHEFLVEDEKFSARFVGAQKGSILFVCMMIAPLSLSGAVVAPALVTGAFYISVLFVTLKYPGCASDSFEEEISNESSQEIFDRRFTDIDRNECIRSRQSSIHRYRRITSTLLSIDLLTNVIGAGSCVIMPLCFMHISKISQGTEPVFTLLFGLFCGIAGLLILPAIRRKYAFTEKQEWTIIVLAFPVAVIAQILYSTYFGVAIGLISASIDGIALIVLASFIHEISARHLTQNQYQQFGCQLEQRNAMARVLVPPVMGGIVMLYSLSVAFYFLCLLGAISSALILARVILIVNGRKLDHRTLSSIENTSHPARELRTNRREGSDVTAQDTRVVVEQLKRQRIRSREKFATYNRLRFRHFIFWSPSSLPQKDKTMASTRGSPR